MKGCKPSMLWGLAALFLSVVSMPSGALAQEDFAFGNEGQGFLMAGLTNGGSFGTLGGGYYLGGEASFVWLENGLWWGAYVDASYDFGQGATTVSIGPEFGWLVLGVDGGFATRFGRQDAPELGFHARAMIALGLFSIYGRYGGWPGPDRMEHIGQVGVTIKLPVWTSYELRPIAP